MMVRKQDFRFYLGISLIILSFYSCSSPKVSIGGDWAGSEYMHLCPHYDFADNGKAEEPLTILGPNNLSLAGTDAIMAIDTAKAYVKQFGGNAFLQNVSLHDISIAYPEKIDELIKQQASFDINRCGVVKYYIRFLFNLRDDTQFRFGIALDEHYSVVSPMPFPNGDLNPSFTNIIPPKKAFKIAMKQHKELLKEVDEIELGFDPQLNSFVWQISGKEIDITPLNATVSKRDYTYGFVRIDAVSGKTLEAAEYEGFKMVCPRYF